MGVVHLPGARTAGRSFVAAPSPRGPLHADPTQGLVPALSAPRRPRRRGAAPAWAGCAGGRRVLWLPPAPPLRRSGAFRMVPMIGEACGAFVWRPVEEGGAALGQASWEPSGGRRHGVSLTVLRHLELSSPQFLSSRRQSGCMWAPCSQHAPLQCGGSALAGTRLGSVG